MMKEISRDNIIYFAGLFDGEGSVGIGKGIDKKRKSGNANYTMQVSFCLTYNPVLIEMQNFFGGNIHSRDKNKFKNYKSIKRLTLSGCCSPDNWKQSYRYMLSGKDALYFLKVIEPFCREKRQQIAVAIRFQERRPEPSHKRSAYEVERCEFFYRSLQIMKHEVSVNKIDELIQLLFELY